MFGTLAQSKLTTENVVKRYTYAVIVRLYGGTETSESIRLTFRFCLIHMLLLLFCLHSFFLILLFLALCAIVIDINSLLLAD